MKDKGNLNVLILINRYVIIIISKKKWISNINYRIWIIILTYLHLMGNSYYIYLYIEAILIAKMLNNNFPINW